MRIRVDHRASRQLVDGGPWMFWRPRAGGTREGLVLELLPCDNRECECRDVTVIGHLVDEQLAEVGATRGGLVFTYAAGASQTMTPATPATRAFVAFETGDVETSTETPETADTARVLAWIADELDGELLDRLHGEWLHAKRWRLPEAHDEGTWAAEWKADRGRLVGWHEAFPHARQDMYGIDDSVTLVLDHYCINPGCTCRDVRVALLEPDGPDRWTQFGDFVYDLGSRRAARFDASTSSKAPLVRAVHAALEARYDVAAHFSHRRARMQEVGRALARVATARPMPPAATMPAKAGRNNLCPCGSGKKYKKCCLNAGG
jgi:hypothetical protein